MPTRGDSRGTLLRRTTTGLPIFEPPGEADDLEELGKAAPRAVHSSVHCLTRVCRSPADLPKLLLVGSAFYTGLNCCTYPLAVIKTRMQASAVSMGSLEAAGELWRISGIRGFYAGIGPVLLGALPARAGYITALEGTKAFWQARAEAAGVTGPTAAAVSNGAAGFGAVLASQTIYTPCDVVTQRVMVASGSGGAAAADASAAHVVRDIWSTSGWSGFYRGFGVTLIAYLPGGSVWWAAYGGARSAASGQKLMPDLAELALAATWASLWTVRSQNEASLAGCGRCERRWRAPWLRCASALRPLRVGCGDESARRAQDARAARAEQGSAARAHHWEGAAAERGLCWAIPRLPPALEPGLHLQRLRHLPVRAPQAHLQEVDGGTCPLLSSTLSLHVPRGPALVLLCGVCAKHGAKTDGAELCVYGSSLSRLNVVTISSQVTRRKVSHSRPPQT